jgi:hypothetical protein
MSECVFNIPYVCPHNHDSKKLDHTVLSLFNSHKLEASTIFITKGFTSKCFFSDTKKFTMQKGQALW